MSAIWYAYSTYEYALLSVFVTTKRQKYKQTHFFYVRGAIYIS